MGWPPASWVIIVVVDSYAPAVVVPRSGSGILLNRPLMAPVAPTHQGCARAWKAVWFLQAIAVGSDHGFHSGLPRKVSKNMPRWAKMLDRYGRSPAAVGGGGRFTVAGGAWGPGGWKLWADHGFGARLSSSVAGLLGAHGRTLSISEPSSAQGGSWVILGRGKPAGNV